MMDKIVGLLSPGMYLALKKIKNKSKVNEFYYEIKKNQKYRNIHDGERCFIIANGPSTKKIDFSLLSNEFTFTVNQMALNSEFVDLKPDYHLWSDINFFEINDSNPEDIEMLETIKAVNRLSPSTEVFYESMAKPMIERFGLQKSTNVNYFQVLGLDPSHMERAFIDFTEPVPNYPTVVDYAILLAVYMGFKQIYLIGCDCTGIINIVKNKMKQAESSLYSYKMTENAAKRLERYSQQRSIIDELNSQAAMFKEYIALNNYCKQNGAKLMNATEGGLLEYIERVNLDDVLNNNNKL